MSEDLINGAWPPQSTPPPLPLPLPVRPLAAEEPYLPSMRANVLSEFAEVDDEDLEQLEQPETKQEPPIMPQPVSQPQQSSYNPSAPFYVRRPLNRINSGNKINFWEDSPPAGLAALGIPTGDSLRTPKESHRPKGSMRTPSPHSVAERMLLGHSMADRQFSQFKNSPVVRPRTYARSPAFLMRLLRLQDQKQQTQVDDTRPQTKLRPDAMASLAGADAFAGFSRVNELETHLPSDARPGHSSDRMNGNINMNGQHHLHSAHPNADGFSGSRSQPMSVPMSMPMPIPSSRPHSHSQSMPHHSLPGSLPEDFLMPPASPLAFSDEPFPMSNVDLELDPYYSSF